MTKRSLTVFLLAVLLVTLLPLGILGHGGSTPQHGLEFDGIDNYGTMPDLFPVDPTELSVAFRVKAENTSTEFRPFSYSQDGFYISFRLNQGGTANRVYVLGYDGAVQEVFTDAFTVTDWLFIGASMEENDNLTLYVNGNQIGNDTIGPFLSVSLGRIIGASRSVATDFLEGIMDNIMVFNDTLTSTEWTTLFNGDESTMENDPNLVMHYKLNDEVLPCLFQQGWEPSQKG